MQRGKEKIFEILINLLTIGCIFLIRGNTLKIKLNKEEPVPIKPERPLTVPTDLSIMLKFVLVYSRIFEIAGRMARILVTIVAVLA